MNNVRHSKNSLTLDTQLSKGKKCIYSTLESLIYMSTCNIAKYLTSTRDTLTPLLGLYYKGNLFTHMGEIVFIRNKKQMQKKKLAKIIFYVCN